MIEIVRKVFSGSTAEKKTRKVSGFVYVSRDPLSLFAFQNISP